MLSKCIKYFLCLLLIGIVNLNGGDFFLVNKKDVLCKFAECNEEINYFINNVFQNWNNEAFDIFDSVENSEGIVIDLGAWIGASTIWFSKKFSYVVAVEADQESYDYLCRNLQASECDNVSVCKKPIAENCKPIIVSSDDNSHPITIKPLTFKQLIHDYIYKDLRLKDKPIVLIRCDIAGQEEEVLEDILYFAYYNRIKVYISFDLNRWKLKKISDFTYLFNYFKNNCPFCDVIAYLNQNPTASIFFEPLNNKGSMIKRNMPVIVIGFNQFTYIKNMVAQLEKYTSDIIVVDNNSNYELLLDYYANDFEYTLLKQEKNYGHTVYSRDFVQKLVGDFYLLTDPDLKFNEKLPANFIQVLVDISRTFDCSKVGFALCIDASDIRNDIFFHGKTIKEWEKASWTKRIENKWNLSLYEAAIDTTFCLINKRAKIMKDIRVAGDYTCVHLPWHTNFKDILQPGEYEAYTNNNISSTWFKRKAE